MKISCIQMNMLLAKPDYNFLLDAELITEAAEGGTDVIVLPEMWNTGFFPKENLYELSDINGRRVKAEIGKLAEKYNINIVAGSVSNIKSNKIYNTSYVFDRSGECVAEYDKTHLFSPMKENEFFERGNSLCRFNLDGIQCGVIICYDLRFPEIVRSMAVKSLDILFVVSQWPKERINHLNTLCRARAIENQMFLACCNSCGRAYDTVFGGGSCIINPWGENLIEAGEGQQIITAECDLSIIKEIRETINVFSDRREDLYFKDIK